MVDGGIEEALEYEDEDEGVSEGFVVVIAGTSLAFSGAIVKTLLPLYSDW